MEKAKLTNNANNACSKSHGYIYIMIFIARNVQQLLLNTVFSLVCENQKIKTKLVCPRLKMGTKMHTKN